MSDAPDRSEKIYDPSPQRLHKAREEGNVFHSRDIVSVGLLAAGMSLVIYGSPFAFSLLKSIAAQTFATVGESTLSLQSAPYIITRVGLKAALALVPFLLALFLVAIGLNVAQTGLMISTKALMPKGSRINPGAGLKRIFSTKGLVELLKALIKVVIILPVAYNLLSKHAPEILMLHTYPLPATLEIVAGWIQDLLFRLVFMLALVSGADYAYERWRWRSDLKMTHQEMKQEVKEQEGDPHIKGKRKAFGRKLLHRPRLDHAVLKADVVVTNPTHYAVALRYNPAEGPAPRVLVKGIRKRALRIKALAIENGIPTIENRPLARALYDSVEEDQEIPEELYPAVAAILAEVYRKKRMNR